MTVNLVNQQHLARSYEAVLEKAIIYKIRSIAFPSIGTGRNAFPLNKAAGIAVETVEKFVESHPDKFDEIVWVLREENTFNAYWNIVK